MHTRKHTCDDSAAATARGADADARSFARLLCSTQSTISVSTSNARTSLYRLLETHKPKPPSPPKCQTNPGTADSSRTKARQLCCHTLIQTQSAGPNWKMSIRHVDDVSAVCKCQRILKHHLHVSSAQLYNGPLCSCRKMWGERAPFEHFCWDCVGIVGEHAAGLGQRRHVPVGVSIQNDPKPTVAQHTVTVRLCPCQAARTTVSQHSLICTGAMPIHLVHSPLMSRATMMIL